MKWVVWTRMFTVEMERSRHIQSLFRFQNQKDVLTYWVVGSEGKEVGPFTDGEKLEGSTLRVGGNAQEVCLRHAHFKIFQDQGDLPSQVSVDFPNFSTKSCMAHQKPQSWENWGDPSLC